MRGVHPSCEEEGAACEKAREETGGVRRSIAARHHAKAAPRGELARRQRAAPRALQERAGSCKAPGRFAAPPQTQRPRSHRRAHRAARAARASPRRVAARRAWSRHSRRAPPLSASATSLKLPCFAAWSSRVSTGDGIARRVAASGAGKGGKRPPQRPIQPEEHKQVSSTRAAGAQASARMRGESHACAAVWWHIAENKI